MTKTRTLLAAIVSSLTLSFAGLASADVYNLKVVTDANPDYTDMDSLVHSITSNWKTDAEKCWALFYWNHIARRQTNPMNLHGMAETDPIMQFNDYGYTMCSTISGINCSIWKHMGYKVKYYDVSMHTVPEVFYDGKYHMYDNSLSCLYTEPDGKTIAELEDIGKTMAGPETDGKEVAGYIAKYHALNGTSPNGYLEGADTNRDLAHMGEVCFKPEYLKYRYYYNDGEVGHRYILNLRDGEVYDREYQHPDELKTNGKDEPTGDPAYFVPNGKKGDGSDRDPEGKNPRYHIRGNGIRTWSNPTPMTVNGDESVYKIEGANVITSLKIDGSASAVSVSTDDGMSWKDVKAPPCQLIKEVNGAYEVLVKAKSPKDIKFETITEINGKTQPRLNLGKNTVYVGAGEQTESIVLWPELQNDKYKPMAVESVNIKTDKEHEGWHGVLGPAEGGEGYVVFKIDAPQDLTRIHQQARMYVKKKGAEVRFEHSFDGGKTWVKSYTFNDITPPFDDYHDEITTDIPAGTKSVLFKYILKDCSLYSVRMEANHKVQATSISPVEVTFNWSERQKDYSLVKRSYTQLVDKMPATFNIDVGGYDQPVVNSLVVNPKGARGELKYGYSDGKDVGGEKWVGKWYNWGKDLAQGKPYTCSVKPSENTWGAGDPDGKIMTDGVVGSNYSGGTTYKEGPLFDKGLKPEIVVDLGEPQKASAFRIHIHGYPFEDALKGQVKDACEVFVSDDNKDFKSVGKFDFNLHWKDLPVNFMWPDEETLGGYNHALILDEPVEARYVKFAVTSSRKMVISEVQVLDKVDIKPFDLKIALPEIKDVAKAD